MVKIYKSFFRNAFNFTGYANRFEYFGILFTMLVIGAFSALEFIVPSIKYLIIGLAIVTYVPLLSLHFRRYHDAGVSGYWVLLFLIVPDVLTLLPKQNIAIDILLTSCYLLNFVVVLLPTKKNKVES